MLFKTYEPLIFPGGRAVGQLPVQTTDLHWDAPSAR
jgi:hypothetical protein